MDRTGEWAQKTGVGSGLRTRVDTVFHVAKQGVYAIYSEKGPRLEVGSERRVGAENGNGEWT